MIAQECLNIRQRNSAVLFRDQRAHTGQAGKRIRNAIRVILRTRPRRAEVVIRVGNEPTITGSLTAIAL